MAEHARHLRIVDEETGEIVGSGCPQCKEYDRELKRMRKIVSDLRIDKDAEARADELWPQAVALFAEWKIATGHTRSRWSGDRFRLCQPYLDTDGFVVCRWAVWGVAYQPYSKKIGSTGVDEVYDEFERPFKDGRGTFERYAVRGWANPEARAQFAMREAGAYPPELEKYLPNRRPAE